MKRTLTIFTSTAAALLVAGCGGSDQTDTTMAEGGGAMPTADASMGGDMMAGDAGADPMATGATGVEGGMATSAPGGAASGGAMDGGAMTGTTTTGGGATSGAGSTSAP